MFSYTFSLPCLSSPALWQGIILQFLSRLMPLPAMQTPAVDVFIIVKMIQIETVWVNNELKCHAFV